MGTAFLYGNGGSGGTGATLTVTAPAGCTVTVSKDGKAKTKTAGADGLAVFQGLATGEWTLTITDGSQTASKVVTVTADYAVSITFFAATINVTYPAGSICTATDGVTTLAAPDTSGTWDCVVPNAGTWTVAAKTSDEAHIARQQVSITSSGQMASVSLSYNLMIYDSGTINSNIGLTTDGYTYSGQNEKTVTFGSASIDFPNDTNVVGTTSAVDVTNYSTLRVTMKSGNTSNTTQPWCALCKEKTTTGSNLISRTSAGSADKITKKIDISSLSGSYYIVVASSSSTGWGTIYDIYLEC